MDLVVFFSLCLDKFLGKILLIDMFISCVRGKMYKSAFEFMCGPYVLCICKAVFFGGGGK